MIDEEIGKYKKRTESNISKSNRKSKHKHIDIECLFRVHDFDLIGHPTDRLYHASYCEICGKVNNVLFFETEKTEYRTHRVLHNDELLAKYPNLPIVEMNDVWDKYVPIEVTENG